MRQALAPMLGMALIASIACNVYSYRLLKSEKELETRQSSQLDALTEKLHATEAQLAQEKRRSQGELDTEKQKLEALQIQLNSQRDLAEKSKQRLLDARSNGPRSNVVVNLQDNLRQEKSYIDGLTRNMQQIRQQESQLGNQSKLSNEQIKWQEEQKRGDLDLQLQNQEKRIQEANKKLEEYKGRKDYICQQETLRYRNELTSEKTALQQLKSQKKTITEQSHNQRTITQSDIQLQQGGLKQTETQIRQNLQSEQARYQALQKQFDLAKKGDQSRSDEIRRLEADHQLQESKAQELESELREQEKILQQLSH